MSALPHRRSGLLSGPGAAAARGTLKAAAGDAAALLRRPGFALGTGVGIGLAWLGGPFGTWLQLAALPRLLYWALAVLPAAVLQVWLSCLVRRVIGPRPLRAGLLAGVLGSLPAWAVVVALEGAMIPEEPMPAAELLPLVVLPVMAVTVLVNLLLGPDLRLPGRTGGAAATASVAPETVPDAALDAAPEAEPGGHAAGEGLFDRLPARLGREVICLNAQGHYLEVTTGRGRILMPISRAVADLAGVPGMRVHRSWWVDLRQVRRRRSAGGRVELVLSTGQVVPVARGVSHALRAALDRHGPPDLAG